MQATADSAVIGQWWETRPEANVILATGRVFDKKKRKKEKTNKLFFFSAKKKRNVYNYNYEWNA